MDGMLIVEDPSHLVLSLNRILTAAGQFLKDLLKQTPPPHPIHVALFEMTWNVAGKPRYYTN